MPSRDRQDIHSVTARPLHTALHRRATCPHVLTPSPQVGWERLSAADWRDVRSCLGWSNYPEGEPVGQVASRHQRDAWEQWRREAAAAGAAGAAAAGATDLQREEDTEPREVDELGSWKM